MYSRCVSCSVVCSHSSNKHISVPTAHVASECETVVEAQHTPPPPLHLTVNTAAEA